MKSCPCTEKGKPRILNFLKNPDMFARATPEAQRVFGVDAAIGFADLLPILEPIGLKLDYSEGDGGVLHPRVPSMQLFDS